MRRIANTHELVSELRGILAEASSANPSRNEIAAKLASLSTRVAAGGFKDYKEAYKAAQEMGKKFVAMGKEAEDDIVHLVDASGSLEDVSRDTIRDLEYRKMLLPIGEKMLKLPRPLSGEITHPDDLLP